MRNIIIITISILFLLSAISVDAGLLDGLPGPEIMPDNPFYVIKIWYEKFILFISFGDTRKVERYSQLAERRLHEAKKMAEKGKEELTEKLLSEYEKYLNKAFEKAKEMEQQAMEKVKEKAKEKISEALEKVSESTLKNQEILLKVYELVPDEIKGTIERVIEITRRGYEQVVKSVSGIKKEEFKQQAEELKNKAMELIKDWQRIFGE